MATVWDNINGRNASPWGGTIFHDPRSSYGAGESMYTTPISGMIREQNLPIAFSSYLNRMGIGDSDRGFNRWAYSQFPRFERSYGLATLENPFITIDDFLATLPNAEGLWQMYQQLDPVLRGIDTQRLAPVARWILR